MLTFGKEYLGGEFRRERVVVEGPVLASINIWSGLFDLPSRPPVNYSYLYLLLPPVDPVRDFIIEITLVLNSLYYLALQGTLIICFGQ